MEKRVAGLTFAGSYGESINMNNIETFKKNKKTYLFLFKKAIGDIRLKYQ